MPITAKVLADSVAPCGKRLTTWEATYPRPIHSEIMTHKMLSKNSASSRAIPTEKLIQRVLDDPWVPQYIGVNQRGMQSGAALESVQAEAVRGHWLAARDSAVAHARAILELGVHKQVINRLLEPWMWITVIISGTEVENFFGLRRHNDAEPHFHHLADLMWEAREKSVPRQLQAGEWHTPLFPLRDEDLEDAKVIASTGYENEFKVVAAGTLTAEEIGLRVSVGRVARVSYLTHDGKRDLREDLKLHDRLLQQSPLHASPAEPIAQALDWPLWVRAGWPRLTNGGVDRLREDIVRWRRENPETQEPDFPRWYVAGVQALDELRSGNFTGFRQYRKMMSNEHIGGLMP